MDKVALVGYVWHSIQNGGVYDPEGLCPCICVGCHSGVEPRIIEFKHNRGDEAAITTRMFFDSRGVKSRNEYGGRWYKEVSPTLNATDYKEPALIFEFFDDESNTDEY